MSGRMNRTIIPGEISGRIKAPSSKSVTQRVLLISAFCSGNKRVGPISGSDDEIAAMDVCKNTGMKVIKDGDFYNIYGEFAEPKYVNVGESGTLLRIILGMLAAKRCKTSIETEGNLLERPLKSLIVALEQIGCSISMKGKTLYFDSSKAEHVENMEIDGGESSQFVSSVMCYMALNPIKKKEVIVHGNMVSYGYIKMTAEILEKFGLKINIRNNVITIEGTLSNVDTNFLVEGDYSSAAFIIAASLLHSTEGVYIENLRKNSNQPDREIINLLSPYVKIEEQENKMILFCKKSNIESVLDMDARSTPDLAPVISLMGMFSDHGCIIRNSTRLVGKESDRKRSIVEIANAFGCTVYEEDDSIIIKKGEKLQYPVVPLSKDHRIIMESLLALSMVYDKFILYNTEFLNKSYPSFIDDLVSVGFTTII
jgi:3-phosphoshikimate 1-carboxyvinyltransferase